jgi:hypothetical protein
MKKPSIFLFWLWLCFLGQAGAISTIEDKTFEVSSLSVAIKNINDVGLVFVRHDKGKVNIASLASWAGIAGSDETELDKYMDEGDNLLIFVLWNKQGKAIDVPYINLALYGFQGLLIKCADGNFNHHYKTTSQRSPMLCHHPAVTLG